MDMQGVSLSNIIKALLEAGTLCIFTAEFIGEGFIKVDAVKLAIGVLVYGGNSDISNVMRFVFAGHMPVLYIKRQ
jgi:hypothetical protein